MLGAVQLASEFQRLAMNLFGLVVLTLSEQDSSQCVQTRCDVRVPFAENLTARFKRLPRYFFGFRQFAFLE